MRNNNPAYTRKGKLVNLNSGETDAEGNYWSWIIGAEGFAVRICIPAK
jgi:hypothetical protein